jgi:hypothetical protein
MSPEEAFRILGISADCSQSELTEAFYDMSRRHHPDADGGSSDAQVQLNAAREIAEIHISQNKALVPARLQQSVKELDKQLSAERAGRQANDLTQRVIRRGMRPLQTMKYSALVLAALAGLVGWFGESLLPQFSLRLPVGGEEGFNLLRAQIKLISVGLAGCAAVLHFFAQRHVFLVEIEKEQLDDVEYCASELAKALRYGDNAVVRQADIDPLWKGAADNDVRSVKSVLRHFLLGLDNAERKRLLILKSIEHGFLESEGPKNVIPASNRTYRVTIRPKEFMPRAKKPDPPPELMGLAEAVKTTIFSVMLAFGLLGWAVTIYPSGWVWVVGGFGALFSLMTVSVLAFGLIPAILRSARAVTPKL